MRFGSVCSGIEAASVAWRPLGWETVYVADIEPFPCAVLASRVGAGRPIHRPDHIEDDVWERGFKGVAWGDAILNFGDFTRIADNPPKVDMLVGGTPCQAFSVAGNRRSLADARGNLTLAYVDLVHATKSLRWAVWENVPGVLSTPDNAFGCFLGGLVGSDDALCVPGGGRWPDAGMVAGPLGRAAWRILDAQHFGVAQRRRRVFVVFCPAGSIGDPAAVLFERKGLPGNYTPGGEAGEEVTVGTGEGIDGGNTAPCLTTGYGKRAGQDFENDGALVHMSPLARCNAAREGISRDFETTTMIAHTLRGEGFDASEDGTGRGTPLVPCQPIAFDTTQITSARNRSRAEPGLPAGKLAKGAHAPAVAFAVRGREGGTQAELMGEQTGVLRGNRGGSSNPFVAHAPDARQSDVCQYGDRSGALDTDPSTIAVQPQPSSAVRRLTPVECERLQGFPDGHTDIMWKGKPAPDGPRYRVLGNSMAVTVMAWIGQRISAFEAGTLDDWRFDWSLLPWVHVNAKESA